MPVQQITIDLIYMAATALGDVIMGLSALLVLLAVIDALVSGLQLLNRGDT